MNTKMLKPKDAAKILDVSEKTLANKRHLGIGPPFLKMVESSAIQVMGWQLI